MNVSFGMLLRKDLAWAMSCLAEEGVTLTGRQEEQLELAIVPGAGGLTRADPNVLRSRQEAVVQPRPEPKPFYYRAGATAAVPAAPLGMVATPMPATKLLLAQALCAFGQVTGRVSTVKDMYSPWHC